LLGVLLIPGEATWRTHALLCGEPLSVERSLIDEPLQAVERRVKLII
jgi:hypothetical protein